MYRTCIKSLLDFSMALLALLLVLPILIVVIILLAFANKGEVFFVQTRPGYLEKPFKIIKFKTMTDEKDKNGNLLPDNKRLTGIGKFVRKTSLDELPQLINVLKGDMSLIGPRPLLVEYLPLYTKEQKKRHQIRPGITGWAQVNGRNALSWNDKFKHDVWYVNNLNFCLDVKIYWLTLKKVIQKEGISSKNSVTMEKFKGNKNE